jgi:hypothetical protein
LAVVEVGEGDVAVEAGLGALEGEARGADGGGILVGEAGAEELLGGDRRSTRNE